MQSKIENYSAIVERLKVDYKKLTDFELLSLAIQIERNQILENGLVVSRNDTNPVGIEAIAMQLGYNNNG